MSRYRSEIDSLRRRERELRLRWRELDREQEVGRYAATRTGRFAFRAGRAVGGWLRRLFRRDEEEVARLREAIMDLEQRIAEREREIEEERALAEAEGTVEESLGYRAGRGVRDAWDKMRD